MDLWLKSRRMWAIRQLNVLFNAKSIRNNQARQPISTLHFIYVRSGKCNLKKISQEQIISDTGDHFHFQKVSLCTAL